MGEYRVISDSPYRITQHYGGTHKGVDLGWRNNENENRVYSNCEGQVIATLDHIPHGSEKGGGWGNYVLIQHPNGMCSRYAHLREGLMVKTGDKVTKDTQVGIIGNSGRSTARHLHFEVSMNSSSSTRINPEPYLTEFIYVSPEDTIKYRAHLEDIGWQEWKAEGQTAGTTGESRRLEAIQINAPYEIYAKAHMEDMGWVDYGKIDSATIIGTVGESRRLECLCFKGNFKYRVHIEGSGWSCWTNADGVATLGSVGQALRIEAIEMRSL